MEPNERMTIDDARRLAQRLHGRLVRMDDCGVTLESGDIVVVFYGNLTVMRGIIE
jgi:hypothetical protein